MSEPTYVKNDELRHTYPYGRHDILVGFEGGVELKERVTAAFAFDPECRRVVVPVDEGDKDQVAACEAAGLRYVLDVETPSRKEYSLMVAEPDWVLAQSTDVKDLELK